MSQTPAEFPRAFANAFGAQDSATLASLFTLNGSFHLLSGAFADGQEEIAAALAEEFAGLCRMTRLVTGKTTLQDLAPGLTLLHQRYVVTGLRDENGLEIPRIAALLTVLLRLDHKQWRAQSANFTVLTD